MSLRRRRKTVVWQATRKKRLSTKVTSRMIAKDRRNLLDCDWIGKGKIISLALVFELWALTSVGAWTGGKIASGKNGAVVIEPMSDVEDAGTPASVRAGRELFMDVGAEFEVEIELLFAPFMSRSGGFSESGWQMGTALACPIRPNRYLSDQKTSGSFCQEDFR